MQLAQENANIKKKRKENESCHTGEMKSLKSLQTGEDELITCPTAHVVWADRCGKILSVHVKVRTGRTNG